MQTGAGWLLQALDWEGKAARVSVVATLSDGSVQAVTATSNTAAVAAATGDAPFALQRPSLSLNVNATFGFAPTCGSYLQSSWSVCAGRIPIGSGGPGAQHRTPNASLTCLRKADANLDLYPDARNRNLCFVCVQVSATCRLCCPCPPPSPWWWAPPALQARRAVQRRRLSACRPPPPCACK